MRNKPRILIVASHLWIGGAETIIDQLCRRIDRAKFTVSICCLVQLGDVGEQLKKDGYDIFCVNPFNDNRVDYFSSLKLNKIVRSCGYDILHSHTTQSLIDANICRILNSKIRTVHTFHFGNYPHYNKKYLFFERLFSRIADRMVTVGKDQNRRILQTFKCKKTPQIIRNGVADIHPSFPPSESIKPYLTGRTTLIGAINTLIEQKGTTYLLDVAKNLKNKGYKCTFIIAGEGPLRTSLEEKVQALELSKEIVFLGWVQDASKRIIPYIDIFFQPSLWEAMSVVVLEAMMCGKPVAVSSVGENPYIIENGKDGLLFQPKNIDEMTRALETLIVDTSLRENMGTLARTKVVKTLGVDSMVREYEQLYEHVYNTIQ